MREGGVGAARGHVQPGRMLQSQAIAQQIADHPVGCGACVLVFVNDQFGDLPGAPGRTPGLVYSEPHS